MNCCEATALETGRAQSIRRAVERAVPTGPGMRTRCLRGLAKALARIRPPLAFAETMGAFKAWHAKAVAHIREKDFGKSLTTFGQFFRHEREAAARVLYRKRKGRLGRWIKEARNVRGDARTKTLHLVALLDEGYGGGDWSLGVRLLAGALGFSVDEAIAILGGLVADGVLEIAQPPNEEERTATRYRLVHRVEAK